ncbi:MAG: PHB depolymerase family esterase [Pseudoxanthomonas sp.]
MSLFAKLLSRLPGATRIAPMPGMNSGLEAQISKTLHDAFAAAGLADAADAPQEIVAPAPNAPPRQPRKRKLQSAASPHSNSDPADGSAAGSFVEHSFSNEFGSRRYKLYVPAGIPGRLASRMPLIVMLHGCTQSPDDFANGTQMNALADQHGFLVAYPAQSPNANGSKCWNWFRPGDQARAAGEPAVLAGLTEEIIARHPVDPGRVYVAGLSAGAAMAVILGITYPELYAGVGAHSGLPYRAASDVPSAFAAMGGTHALREVQAETEARVRHKDEASASVTPLIVFHGDADRTVAPANGEALVRQAISGAAAVLPESGQQDAAANGRRYTRSVYTTSLGDPLVEYWQLHGAGHAWSGGSRSGTYTDPKGPDASAEMVRFFQQVAQRGLDRA